MKRRLIEHLDQAALRPDLIKVTHFTVNILMFKVASLIRICVLLELQEASDVATTALIICLFDHFSEAGTLSGCI